MDWWPTCLVFRKAHPTLGSKFFNSLLKSVISLKNEKIQFRIALKKILYAHSFYSGWIFCVYRWYVLPAYMTVVNVYFTLYCFYIFVCLITCCTFYCLVTVSGIPGMYSALYCNVLYCIVLLYKYESYFVSQKFKIYCQLNVTQRDALHQNKHSVHYWFPWHIHSSSHRLSPDITITYLCVHTHLSLSCSVQSVAVLSL